MVGIFSLELSYLTVNLSILSWLSLSTSLLMVIYFWIPLFIGHLLLPFNTWPSRALTLLTLSTLFANFYMLRLQIIFLLLSTLFAMSRVPSTLALHFVHLLLLVLLLPTLILTRPAVLTLVPSPLATLFILVTIWFLGMPKVTHYMLFQLWIWVLCFCLYWNWTSMVYTSSLWSLHSHSTATSLMW